MFLVQKFECAFPSLVSSIRRRRCKFSISNDNVLAVGIIIFSPNRI